MDSVADCLHGPCLCGHLLILNHFKEYSTILTLHPSNIVGLMMYTVKEKISNLDVAQREIS